MKSKKKKRLIITIIILIILVLGVLTYIAIYARNKPGSGGSGAPVKRVPLSPEERDVVIQTVLSSEFVKDVPEDEPIGLIFYDFENGERIWQDSFLIGKNGFITSGEPTIYLSLHSKYIPEIKNDLCGTIKKANQNGDLGFQSEHNKASLLWKYKGMLPHRDCFGF